MLPTTKMSNSKLLAELIPNMVARKDSLSGSGKSGPPEFSETNFDVYVAYDPIRLYFKTSASSTLVLLKVLRTKYEV